MLHSLVNDASVDQFLDQFVVIRCPYDLSRWKRIEGAHKGGLYTNLFRFNTEAQDSLETVEQHTTRVLYTATELVHSGANSPHSNNVIKSQCF